jgi:hypothetical protein
MLDPLASCPHNIDLAIKLFIIQESGSFFGGLGDDCQQNHATVTVLVGEGFIIVKHGAS